MALNQVEVWAALQAHDGITSIRNGSPDKKVSSCFLKPTQADGGHDANALRAAPGPQILLIVSDTAGPPLVDPKAAASEPSIPGLGDHATIVAGPMPNDLTGRKAFRVWVNVPSRSYVLIYSPDVMNQGSQDVAVHLAREILLGDFKGRLDTYPIAEQLIARDKNAVIQKPDDFGLWNEIGLFSQYLRRYEAAREAYLRISELLPNDPGGFLGVAAADLGKARSEKSDLTKSRGISATTDIALNPEYRELCDALKQQTQTILDEGYADAKKATQLQPDDYFSYLIVSLLIQQKASTECGDPVAAKADIGEGDQFATLSREKSKEVMAARMRGQSHLQKVSVGLDPPQAPMAISTGPGAAGSVSVAGGAVSVESGIEVGLLIHQVNPIYPPVARQARVQGVVILAAQINKDGEVENLQLISGHPMLVSAAIDAVKQWKYKPYLLNGVPVAVSTQIQVNFGLASP